MANHWLRLWTDLPNDPKWRTISRVSKQPISSVISVYIHMLVSAANNSDNPGHLYGWVDEDIASALDLDESDVISIREAMQGRVLDGDFLSGWEKRQPKREDKQGISQTGKASDFDSDIAGSSPASSAKDRKGSLSPDEPLGGMF